MASKQFDQLYELFKMYPLNLADGLDKMREAYNNMAVSFKPIKGAKFEEVNINGVRAEWVKMPNSDEDSVLIYLHGGGYVLGTTEMYHDMAARLASGGEVKVLSVDYRLAPENKYPAALEDSIKVYKWLLSQNYKYYNIMIAGDSAGGGLALATLLKIRSLGLKMPAAAVCISPWTDLAMTGKTIKTNSVIDPVLNYDLLKYFADCCVGEEGDRCDPFISPFYADLSGLPPLLIMVGECEILLDDAMRFSNKAEFFGVESTFVVAKEMTHSWPFFASIIPEGQQAINYISEYIRRYI